MKVITIPKSVCDGLLYSTFIGGLLCNLIWLTDKIPYMSGNHYYGFNYHNYEYIPIIIIGGTTMLIGVIWLISEISQRVKIRCECNGD